MTIEAAAWDHCSLLQVAQVIFDTDRPQVSRVPATIQCTFVQDLIPLTDGDKHCRQLPRASSTREARAVQGSKCAAISSAKARQLETTSGYDKRAEHMLR